METKFGQTNLKINKKISAEELNKIMTSEFNFDFAEWDIRDGKECIVMFSDEIDTVIFNDFNKDKDEVYRKKEGYIKDLIERIFNCIDSNECLVIKDNEKWITNREECKMLDRVLKENDISDTENCGIYVPKDSPMIPLFVEATLRYFAFVSFVFEKEKVIIAPSDHMDLFIFYERQDIYSTIKECVKLYNQDRHIFAITQRSNQD